MNDSQRFRAMKNKKACSTKRILLYGSICMENNSRKAYLILLEQKKKCEIDNANIFFSFLEKKRGKNVENISCTARYFDKMISFFKKNIVN